MIIGTLSDVSLATKVHPAMKTFFDFIKSRDFNELPLGRIDIHEDEIYVNNLDINGVDACYQPLEMHKQYIDVHIVLGGEEKIGWKPIERISTFSKKYNEENDCALTRELPDTYVTLHPGDFCIVFPEDAHAPAISDGKIRKLIGKIKV